MFRADFPQTRDDNKSSDLARALALEDSLGLVRVLDEGCVGGIVDDHLLVRDRKVHQRLDTPRQRHVS